MYDLRQCMKLIDKNMEELTDQELFLLHHAVKHAGFTPLSDRNYSLNMSWREWQESVIAEYNKRLENTQ